MANDAEKPENEDDELVLDEDQRVDAGKPEEGDEPGDDDDDQQKPGDEEGADEEEVLTFGDDLTEEKPDDSSVIKLLREQLREARKEAKESRTATPAPEKIEVGPKPTLEGCEYDEEKYEAELDAWKDRKAKAERQQTEIGESQRKETEAWQAELSRYNEGKKSLGYADVDDAEETVVAALSEVQQAVLVKAADAPHKVMYALGKHPDRLAQLAKISDPLKFAAAVAKLEGQLKVVKKRKAPDPDVPESGSGSVSAGKKDKELERLEKEADKTGDRTKLQQYKKKHGIK